MATDFPKKSIDATTRLCLEKLEAGLVETGLRPVMKVRGHFGSVRRFHFDQSIWFDVLPARAWLLFYFSPAASRVAGLQFARVRQVFEQAEERKDGIVKIRLFHEGDAHRLVEVVSRALQVP
jgi:hypothetical protein